MPAPDQHSAQLRQMLRLSLPELDTSVGTPMRKIVDVFSEGLSEVSIDQYLLRYQHDIDSKSGADLDAYVRGYGMTRLPARRATGLVSLERTTPATRNYNIQINTQLSTTTPPVAVVVTATPAILTEGATSVTVPVQALVAGAGGNVPANAVTRALSSIQGVATISNPAALTGGADAESDAALRDRFKRTLFRSMAGTDSMYLATALEDPGVADANVLGAVIRHREQIQIVGGTGTSTVTDAKYIYAATSTVGTDIDAGDILQESVDYSISGPTTIPPVITSLDGTNMPDGIYEVEYDYASTASRNDPDDGVTNKVDIWTQGSRAVQAVETAIFKTARVFNTTSGSALHRNLYERLTEAQPTAGNHFITLNFKPIIELPSSLEIDGVTYVENTDYWLVREVTANRGSPKETSGIEFLSDANGLVPDAPDDGQHFSVDYSFNAVPMDIEAALQRWRLVNQDVRVHQARQILLNFYFTAILSPGYTSAMVKPGIIAAINQYIATLGFRGILQTSDVLAAAHGATGVDAIRFTTSTEGGDFYAMRRVRADGTVTTTYYASGGRATDVYAEDDALIALNDVSIIVKAQNTFGTV